MKINKILNFFDYIEDLTINSELLKDLKYYKPNFIIFDIFGEGFRIEKFYKFQQYCLLITFLTIFFFHYFWFILENILTRDFILSCIAIGLIVVFIILYFIYYKKCKKKNQNQFAKKNFYFLFALIYILLLFSLGINLFYSTRSKLSSINLNLTKGNSTKASIYFDQNEKKYFYESDSVKNYLEVQCKLSNQKILIAEAEFSFLLEDIETKNQIDHNKEFNILYFTIISLLSQICLMREKNGLYYVLNIFNLVLIAYFTSSNYISNFIFCFTIYILIVLLTNIYMIFEDFILKYIYQNFRTFKLNKKFLMEISQNTGTKITFGFFSSSKDLVIKNSKISYSLNESIKPLKFENELENSKMDFMKQEEIIVSYYHRILENNFSDSPDLKRYYGNLYLIQFGIETQILSELDNNIDYKINSKKQSDFLKCISKKKSNKQIKKSKIKSIRQIEIKEKQSNKNVNKLDNEFDLNLNENFEKNETKNELNNEIQEPKSELKISENSEENKNDISSFDLGKRSEEEIQLQILPPDNNKNEIKPLIHKSFTEIKTLDNNIKLTITKCSSREEKENSNNISQEKKSNNKLFVKDKKRNWLIKRNNLKKVKSIRHSKTFKQVRENQLNISLNENNNSSMGKNKTINIESKKSIEDKQIISKSNKFENYEKLNLNEKIKEFILQNKNKGKIIL